MKTTALLMKGWLFLCSIFCLYTLTPGQSPKQDAEGLPDETSPRKARITEIKQGKFEIGSEVQIEGTSGTLDADAETPNEIVFSLRDIYGGVIKIKSTQRDLEVGRGYVVVGVVGRGRIGGSRTEEYFLYEKSREFKAIKLSGEGKIDEDTSEEGDSWLANNWHWLIALGGIMLSAVIVLTVLGRNRSDAERRRREEAARKRLEVLQSPPESKWDQSLQQSEHPPTSVVSGPKQAAKKHDGTVEMWGTLEIISGPQAGQKLPLAQRSVRIGRSEGDILLTDDETISGIHAEIMCSADGRVIFVDTSRNGSRVNGEIVHRAKSELSPGATIEIGMTTLVFQAGLFGPSETTKQAELKGGADATSAFLGAEVTVIRGPDAGKSAYLSKPVTSIGRSEGCDFALTDATVSRLHCEIRHDGGQFRLLNQSAQGTSVNGASIGSNEQELSSGDEIQLGGTTVRFSAIGG